jgi:hypothetical protein
MYLYVKPYHDRSRFHADRASFFRMCRETAYHLHMQRQLYQAVSKESSTARAVASS